MVVKFTKTIVILVKRRRGRGCGCWLLRFLAWRDCTRSVRLSFMECVIIVVVVVVIFFGLARDVDLCFTVLIIPVLCLARLLLVCIACIDKKIALCLRQADRLLFCLSGG